MSCDYEVVAVESVDDRTEEVLGGGYDLVLIAAEFFCSQSGLDFCAELRQRGGDPPTPLIVYAGDRRPSGEPERSYSVGAHAYVPPDELPLLERIVASTLRSKSRLDILAEHHHLLRLEQRQLTKALQRSQQGLPRESLEEYKSRPVSVGRPEAVILVGPDGRVDWSDRGARALLGSRLDGQGEERPALTSLLPAAGVEDLVRAARHAPRDGQRLDQGTGEGGTPKPLSASVFPLGDSSGIRQHAVLLTDAGKVSASGALAGGSYGSSLSRTAAVRAAGREFFGPARIPGRGVAGRRLRARTVERAADGDPVLLVGEPGTGRAFLARVIHHLGDGTSSFRSLRCVALSVEGLTVELFGHSDLHGPAAGQSRFLGALHPGSMGSLLLEDVHALPASLQRRVLEAVRAPRCAVRLFATTDRDLNAQASQGDFLPDLARHLSSARIQVPALRERHDEFEGLVLDELARCGAAGIHPDTLAALRRNDWPRNLKELAEVLEAASHAAGGGQIGHEHLPVQLRRRLLDLVDPSASPETRDYAPGAPLREREVPRPWHVREGEPISFELFEKKAIQRALHACDGDKLAAARLLKVGKSTLYRKIRRFGID